MNVNIQIKSINTILFITGIFLVTFSYQKLNIAQNQQYSPKTQLGIINEFSNDVRIKKSANFQWSNIVSPSRKIGINDKIFSNTNSHATIKLNIGHQIHLKEQSLIRIKDANTIKIDQGVASFSLVKTERPYVIYLGEKKIKIKALIDSKITISNNQNLSSNDSVIKLDTGAIEIAQKEKIVKLLKNDKVILDNQKPMTKYDLSFPKETVLYTKKTLLPVEFKFSGPNNKIDIILSKEINFNTFEKVLSPKYLKSLPPGKYFWKVGESFPETFKIMQNPPYPTIIYPLGDQQIYTYQDKVNIKIEVTNDKLYPKAILGLFNLDHQLLIEKKYTGSSVDLKDVPIGFFYIRAKLQGKLYSSSWSNKRIFQVVKRRYSSEKPLIIELKKPNQMVKFEWVKNQKDLSLFEVSGDQNFKKIIISKRIRSKNYTHINFPKVGIYYWRSRKVGTDGKLSAQPPVQVIIKPTPPPTKPKALPNLNIKVPSKKRTSSTTSFLQHILNNIFPTAHASDDISKHSLDIEISFPKIDNAKSYKIEIYNDHELKNQVKSISTSKTNFIWSPPQAGNYYWRISYIDFWDRQSDFSDASELKVEFEKAIHRKKKKKKYSKRKNKTKKRISKKTAPIKAKLIQKTKAIQKSYQLSFLIGPTSFNFSQKLSRKISVQGETYNGWQLDFKKSLSTKFTKSLRVNYQTYSGEVFNGERFQIRQIEISLLSNYYGLSPLVQFKQLPKYKISNSKARYSGDHLSVSPGVRIGKTIIIGKKHEFEGILGLSALGHEDYFLGVNCRYYYNNKISLLAKATLYNSSLDLSDEPIDYQYFQLVTGVKYPF